MATPLNGAGDRPRPRLELTRRTSRLESISHLRRYPSAPTHNRERRRVRTA